MKCLVVPDTTVLDMDSTKIVVGEVIGDYNGLPVVKVAEPGGDLGKDQTQFKFIVVHRSRVIEEE